MFTELSISRTPCYGECPVYEVVVHHDGEVKWTGHEFVDHLGESHFRISPEQVKQIETLLEIFDYRSFCYPESDVFATDQPSCITNVVFKDGFEKEIDHYLGDSQINPNDHQHSFENLEKLEEKLEQILGLEKYI
ncbi:DUF6438 domain-containing protein [Oceanobacillus halotolerans]|uniref:DUF6438 domain-containing protein n=1 Tax=Oceanobacillus halotolerans TaxID=2663380 RepID=UPI0013DA4CDD|nr:DUF6438 domain-containing protein [Oceanobacillus halotolerans]